MNGRERIMESNARKYKTWIEIDRSAIKHNYESFKSLLDPKTKFMAVVKSNAYGHDIVQFSKEVEALGVDFFAVDEAREAFLLQDSGIKKPILILGYIEPDLFEEVVKRGVSFVVSNFNTLDRAVALKNLNPKIHIDVDTGLGRLGFLERDMEKSFGGFDQGRTGCRRTFYALFLC